MAIIEVTKENKQPYLGKLMKKLISNRRCLALLRFFVVHPHERYSELAITCAIADKDSRPDIQKALAQMVNEGILQSNIENGFNFYRLTREEPVRQTILEMAEFDWRHWQLVLEYM